MVLPAKEIGQSKSRKVNHNEREERTREIKLATPETNARKISRLGSNDDILVPFACCNSAAA